MLVSQGKAQVTRKDQVGHMRELLEFMYNGQRARFAASLAFVTANSLLDVVLAFVMMRCVDCAINGSPKEAFDLLTWLMIYLVAYYFVSLLTAKVKLRTVLTAQHNLRKGLSSKLLALPISRFRARNTGEWVSLLTTSCDTMAETFFANWFNAYSELLSFAVSMIYLCFISPQLASFVVGTAIIQALIPALLGKTAVETSQKQAEAAGDYLVTATEHLNGYELLRSFSLTSQSLQSLDAASQELGRASYLSRFVKSKIGLLSFSFGNLIYVGTYFVGALLTLAGSMTVGEMIAASQLVVYIASPLQTLNAELTDLASASKLYASMQEELSGKEPASEPSATLAGAFSTISFEGVSFSYGSSVILRDVDLTIKRGGKCLLQGPSGSGKSTFLKLITGAEAPIEGTVCINGVSIQSLGTKQLSRVVLPCSQSTFIFNASLRDNVALFDESFEDADIVSALREVELGYLVDRYKEGLDHVISQEGQTLSGGEKQKIALARMRLFNPPVVTLDESFANLDADSAKKLLSMVLSDEERTVIVVAHQITAELVGMFDRRFVIEDQHICEIAKEANER